MIKPFGNQILIKPSENKGVLGDKSLCKYGEVIDVGDEVKNVKVGQTIGFIEWGMNKLIMGNDEYYFIQEENRFILGYVGMPE